MNETVFRYFRAGLAGLFFLIGSCLVSCQTEDPPEGDHILRLTLHDSLAKYDSVTVLVLDLADTTKVLATLWTGPMPSPSKIPGKVLDSAWNKPFVVKVIGYAADDQVALTTLIYYDGTKKTAVVHVDLPPVVPKKWITRISPSAGTITPSLAQDVLDYQLKLPDGVTSISLDVVAAHSKAVLTVDGDTVTRGERPKEFSVGGGADTIPIVVSELGATRAFSVALIPHSAVPVALARIAVDAPARLDPEFDNFTTEYGLNVYAGAETATVTCFPADPLGMTMFVRDNGVVKSIFTNVPFTARIAAAEDQHFLQVGVVRGTDTLTYDLYMQHR